MSPPASTRSLLKRPSARISETKNCGGQGSEKHPSSASASARASPSCGGRTDTQAFAHLKPFVLSVDWRALDVEWIGRVAWCTQPLGQVEECLRRAASCRWRPVHGTRGFAEIESFGGNPRASFLDHRYRQNLDLAHCSRRSTLGNLVLLCIDLAPAPRLGTPDPVRAPTPRGQHQQRIVGQTLRADRGNQSPQQSPTRPGCR